MRNILHLILPNDEFFWSPAGPGNNILRIDAYGFKLPWSEISLEYIKTEVGNVLYKLMHAAQGKALEFNYNCHCQKKQNEQP